MVYLIHFSKPLHHAQHYIGYCEEDNLEKRELRHRAGNGAKILRAIKENNIEYEIVRIWPGKDRLFERQLKNRKKARRLCPLCNKKSWSNNAEE